MDKIALEKVGPVNLSDCGIGCLTDPKNQGYQPKVEWLRRRFACFSLVIGLLWDQ